MDSKGSTHSTGNVRESDAEITELSTGAWSNPFIARLEVMLIKVCRIAANDDGKSIAKNGYDVIRRDKVAESVFFVIKSRDRLLRIKICKNVAVVLSSDKVGSLSNP